jgi:hypothetical protein
MNFIEWFKKNYMFLIYYVMMVIMMITFLNLVSVAFDAKQTCIDECHNCTTITSEFEKQLNESEFVKNLINNMSSN